MLLFTQEEDEGTPLRDENDGVERCDTPTLDENDGGSTPVRDEID